MRSLVPTRPRLLQLALVLLGLVAVVGVAGASAADFAIDDGPCRETPGEQLLLRCPTGYVGQPYEVELLSEEGSGCSPDYDYFVLVNSTLPPGLSMNRDGVISGIPTTAGFTRFWVHNHDLSKDQGGPDWCIRDDTSEHEFSIYVDPGVEIATGAIEPATLGQPYAVTLTASQVVSLNPPTGPTVQAMWSLESGSLPPGIALGASGALSGTPTAEGSYQFVVKALYGATSDTKTYMLSVRRALALRSPFGAGARPLAEVGHRFTASATATGGSGTYVWSVASGGLPPGLALDASTGAVTGTPTTAGNYPLQLKATDSEGRTATADGAIRVAARLAVRPFRAGLAKRARPYRAKLGAFGGVQPIRWKIVRGKLPLGVRLAQASGTLMGKPRRAGTFPLVVEARDALGVRARQTLVLRVMR